MGDSEGSLVQVIVFVLIGIGWAVAQVVKRANRWIDVHRMPTGLRESEKEGSGGSEGVSRQPPAVASSRAPAPQRRKGLAETLMAELEKAMAGAGGGPTAPTRAAAPEVQARELLPPKATVADSESLRERSARRVKERAQATATRIEVAAAATVGRSKVGHLAALRSRDDLKRAVILHEILGPPKALHRSAHSAR